MKIQDYIHFYAKAEYSAIPQHALDRQPVDCFIKTMYSDGTEIEMAEIDGGPAFFSFYADIKPYLRPLSSMTEEDVKGLGDVCGLKHFTPVKVSGDGPFIQMEYLQTGAQQTDYIHWYIHQLSAPMFVYLLSLGFDLFGLIPAGIALDATVINNNEKV